VSELHASGHSSSSWRRILGEFLHHAYVALVLAALALIFEHQGWLNWLDSLSLRVASNVTIGVTEGQRQKSASIQDRPLTLLISDEMFERDFNQASPLERGRLADLIRPILAKNPSVLAIDLDLSPGPALADTPAQHQLEDVLAQGARSGTRVVLTTPFPVFLDSVITEKYNWMRKLCASGVEFAFPYLLEMQGLVLRYPSGIETLGQVSARADRPSGQGSSLCDQVKLGIQNAAFLSKDYPVNLLAGFDNLATQRPLNPAFFDDVQTFVISGVADLVPIHLKQRIVVLGAGFNPSDQFNTAFGNQKGPVLHAATIFSVQHPTHISHTFSILLDLVLGIAAGFLFHAVWHRFDKHQQKSSSLGHWPPSHFLAARSWILISCAILVAAVVMVTISSAWLFRHNLWNNPGPMMIGFFVKTLIASRPHSQHAEAHGKSIGPLHRLMQHIDHLWFLPIVVWGIFLFFH